MIMSTEPECDNSSEGSDFVATDEMLTYAYDDESTINDDEDLDDDSEVDNLKLEGEMPIEELLLKYGPKVKYDDCYEKSSADACGTSDNNVNENTFMFDNKSSTQSVEPHKSECIPNIADINGQVYEDDDNHLPRGSSRLWCKALIDNNSNYNSEDDGDYIPLIDSKLFSNAQIRIGECYQVVSISSIKILNPNDYYSCKEREILIWKALNDSEQFQSDLKLYLKDYGKLSGQTALISSNIDDATALFTLMEHDYDVKTALMFLKNKPIKPSDLPNIMQSWSEQECLEFEKGFETYYKNFRLIREQRLRTRTVAEIVEFYYFWKKTARYDDVIRWCKRDKKKPINQITDFIDCLASDSNGRKENCLLGNWPGKHVDNQILQLPEEMQTAKFLNNILLRNGNEFESVLSGDWNITTSSLTSRIKESSDTSNDDKLSEESKNNSEKSVGDTENSNNKKNKS